jgi:hypothetical protein
MTLVGLSNPEALNRRMPAEKSQKAGKSIVNQVLMRIADYWISKGRLLPRFSAALHVPKMGRECSAFD